MSLGLDPLKSFQRPRVPCTLLQLPMPTEPTCPDTFAEVLPPKGECRRFPPRRNRSWDPFRGEPDEGPKSMPPSSRGKSAVRQESAASWWRVLEHRQALLPRRLVALFVPQGSQRASATRTNDSRQLLYTRGFEKEGVTD